MATKTPPTSSSGGQVISPEAPPQEISAEAAQQEVTPESGEPKQSEHEGHRLKKSEIVSYGFGDFGNGFMFDLGQNYLLRFWTGAGIPAGVVSAIMSGTKIFDAFMDPTAAAWIDSRKAGPRGKFRPVMMGGAILLAILTVITFTMPQFSLGGKIWWAVIFYALWGVGYAFTNNPYQSLASVMTRDTKQRAQLATSRQAGSLGAQWITGFAFIPILTWLSSRSGDSSNFTASAWAIPSIVMALVGVIAFWICYRGSHEHVKVLRQVGYKRNSFGDYAKVVFTNRPLGGLILMQLFTISSMNVYNSLMIFYATYNLGNAMLTSVINLIMIGVSIITIFFIPTLVTKFGKKQIAIVGLIVCGAGALLNGILPTNFWTFVVLVTISYAGLAIPNGVTWAFVADTMDYAEWNTGVRKEAITSAAFNFSRKLAQSLAAAIAGGVLAWTGYVAHAHTQPERVFSGIKNVMAFYPTVAMILAILALALVYNLTDQKFDRVAADLNEGLWRGGRIADLVTAGDSTTAPNGSPKGTNPPAPDGTSGSDGD